MNIDSVNLANLVSGFKDVDNLYPWEQVAYCVRLHWNFLKFTEHECPKCKNRLISLAYQPLEVQNDVIELNICTSCQSQYDSSITLLQNDKVIDFDYIRSINPFTFVLAKLIKSIGCPMTYHKEVGEYGAILFEYKNATLGIWINDTYAVNVFFPNWAVLPVQALSKDIIASIQTQNLNNHVCVYWLCKDNSYTLSSSISIDINLINEDSSAFIKESLSQLIESKNFFTNSINNRIEHRLPEKSIECIKSTLESCSCEYIEIDDENDIHFKWNDNSMYLTAIDDSYYKIVFNLVMIEDVTDDSDSSTDIIDMNALAIQWSNMIWPIKCSFYKPDERHTSITATIDIACSHLIDGHLKFVSRRLVELVNFYDECLNDLLFGTENGCDILDTYYQPDIINYDAK